MTLTLNGLATTTTSVLLTKQWVHGVHKRATRLKGLFKLLGGQGLSLIMLKGGLKVALVQFLLFIFIFVNKIKLTFNKSIQFPTFSRS
jgi:hypothetical protein